MNANETSTPETSHELSDTDELRTRILVLQAEKAQLQDELANVIEDRAKQIADLKSYVGKLEASLYRERASQSKRERAETTGLLNDSLGVTLPENFTYRQAAEGEKAKIVYPTPPKPEKVNGANGKKAGRKTRLPDN